MIALPDDLLKFIATNRIRPAPETKTRQVLAGGCRVVQYVKCAYGKKDGVLGLIEEGEEGFTGADLVGTGATIVVVGCGCCAGAIVGGTVGLTVLLVGGVILGEGVGTTVTGTLGVEIISVGITEVGSIVAGLIVDTTGCLTGLEMGMGVIVMVGVGHTTVVGVTDLGAGYKIDVISIAERNAGSYWADTPSNCRNCSI